MKVRTMSLVLGAVLALGVAADASALSFGMKFKGYLTMISPFGSPVKNSSFSDNEFYGYRSPIDGVMVLDIDETGMRGAAAFDPFPFFGVRAAGRDITFVPVAEILNIPTNTLLLGNMLFDYGEGPGALVGIPVSIVLDMGNLTTALMESSPGDVIRGVMRGATDNTVFNLPDGSKSTLPMGPVVVATTTWDTTLVDTDGDGEPGPAEFGTNPSGTVPLQVDSTVDPTNGDIGIGGSPIPISDFRGFSPNFDIAEVTVTCVNVIGNCSAGGITVPEIPLSPEPLEPLQDEAGDLLGGLGL